MSMISLDGTTGLVTANGAQLSGSPNSVPGLTANAPTVQSGSLTYLTDSSTTAGIVTLIPASGLAFTPVAGTILRWVAGTSNTGAVTLTYNSGTATPLVGPGGALQGGEIIAGQSYEAILVTISGVSSWVLLGQTGGAASVANASALNHALNGNSAIAGFAQTNFCVQAATGQAIPAGANTTLVFGTTIFDDLTEWASPYWTAKYAGTYVFQLAVGGTSSTATDRALTINDGNSVAVLSKFNLNASICADILVYSSPPINRTKGQKVLAQYYSGIADTLSTGYFCQFSGYRVK